MNAWLIHFSATHIVRAAFAGHPVPAGDTCSRSLINVLNRLISSTDTPRHRMKACFILCAYDFSNHVAWLLGLSVFWVDMGLLASFFHSTMVSWFVFIYGLQ